MLHLQGSTGTRWHSASREVRTTQVRTRRQAEQRQSWTLQSKYTKQQIIVSTVPYSLFYAVYPLRSESKEFLTRKDESSGEMKRIPEREQTSNWFSGFPYPTIMPIMQPNTVPFYAKSVKQQFAVFSDQKFPNWGSWKLYNPLKTWTRFHNIEF
jgi:hypothetical protein